MLTLIILHKLHTKSVDFVLAYNQTDVKSEIYMDLPLGFVVDISHPREWVIRIDKNLYGLKDARLACFEKLKEVLEARCFLQFQVNPCVWYK